MGCSNSKPKEKAQESNVNQDGKIEEDKEQDQKQNNGTDETKEKTVQNRKNSHEVQNIQHTPPQTRNENGNDIVTNVEYNSQSVNSHTMDDDINKQNKMRKEVNKGGSIRILDVNKYFTDEAELKTITGIKDDSDKINRVQDYAEKLRNSVENFQEEKHSLEYFVLDEKLMRSIEELDKIKSHNNKEITEKKIKVIEKIKEMHATLDRHSKKLEGSPPKNEGRSNQKENEEISKSAEKEQREHIDVENAEKHKKDEKTVRFNLDFPITDVENTVTTEETTSTSLQETKEITGENNDKGLCADSYPVEEKNVPTNSHSSPVKNQNENVTDVTSDQKENEKVCEISTDAELDQKEYNGLAIEKTEEHKKNEETVVASVTDAENNVARQKVTSTWLQETKDESENTNKGLCADCHPEEEKNVSVNSYDSPVENQNENGADVTCVQENSLTREEMTETCLQITKYENENTNKYPCVDFPLEQKNVHANPNTGVDTASPNNEINKYKKNGKETKSNHNCTLL